MEPRVPRMSVGEMKFAASESAHNTHRLNVQAIFYFPRAVFRVHRSKVQGLNLKASASSFFASGSGKKLIFPCDVCLFLSVRGGL